MPISCITFVVPWQNQNAVYGKMFASPAVLEAEYLRECNVAIWCCYSHGQDTQGRGEASLGQ
jgi:hypothetical protein